ncbi:MAG: hypothetical protein JXC31_01800 [Acholeplasmataceae bacterium]|nr:hypothetical protein [Acholeplasmataceae bacterium]
MKSDKEKNIYQKYDDLFEEQDQAYTKNNKERYKDKKTPTSFQIIENNQIESDKRKNKKPTLSSGFVSLILFGSLINFILIDRGYRTYITPILIFFLMLSIFLKKYKAK